MNEQRLIPARATFPDEQSDSIVVSFGPQWHEHLLAERFSLVIRKRIPKAASFKWLYLHINSPVGAICARAPITRIFSATKEEAVAMAKNIRLTSDQITSYVGKERTIGCYELGSFQFPKRPITTSELATGIVYHPPQSFFILSKAAKEIIDTMACFKPAEPRKIRTRAIR
jgi:predicted transcriptional regulator